MFTTATPGAHALSMASNAASPPKDAPYPTEVGTATTGADARLNLQHLFARQLSLMGSYMGTKSELLRAADLFFAGAFRPVVDRTFPLREVADAHRHLESSRQFGKVVLVT